MSVCRKAHLIINTDSTAGKSMAMGYGASRKTRHVDLKLYYMQSLVNHGRVRIMKVPVA